MSKKIFSLASIIAVLLLSCKKQNLPDIGGTAAQKMANEWWVTLDQDGTQDVFGVGHFKMATYNTADNGNQLWVDDLTNGYGAKVKAAADFAALTFSTANAANFYYDSTAPAKYPKTVTITDGKILTKAGHSKSGNIVDSLHLKIEFSDDPGTIYEMNGVERTRFIEDDY